MKTLLLKTGSATIATLIGLGSAAGLICSSAAPTLADSYSSGQPQFNARIIDPPTNCRATPDGEIVRVFGRGVISLDPHPIPSYDGNWYKELYNNCYVHESQFRWGTSNS